MVEMITGIDLSQEIFASNGLRTLKSSLKHRRKHVLRSLQLYGDQALSCRNMDKPGLHFVVRVAEHACDDASKRILKPSTCRLQIFLVRD